MGSRSAKDCMVRLALRFPYLRPIKPAMDVIRPPGFQFHSHMSIRRSEPYGRTPGLGRTWKTGRPLRLLTSCCRKELAQRRRIFKIPTLWSQFAYPELAQNVALICLEGALPAPRKCLHDFLKQPNNGFGNSIGRWSFWRHLLAAIARFRLAIGKLSRNCLEMAVRLKNEERSLRGSNRKVSRTMAKP